MHAAGVTVEQIFLRGLAFLCGGILVQLIIGLARLNRDGSGTAKALGLFAWILSTMAQVMGLSIMAGSATLLGVRRLFPAADHEVQAAIVFVGTIAGLYAGMIGCSRTTSWAYGLAGVDFDKRDLPVFGFRKWRRQGRRRSEADRRFGAANTVAWVILALVIGLCLWRDAPNWVLLSACLVVAGATIVSSRFGPENISKGALNADWNSGLFLLAGFVPLGLALRAMYRFELVDWRLPLLVALAIGLPMTALQMRPLGGLQSTGFRIGNRPAGPIGMVLGALFLCFMGSGSLVWSGLQFANASLPPELIVVHHVRIAELHAQKSRNGTTYTMVAANPPDLNDITTFRLGAAAYARLQTGGEACIEVWRGSLALRWYRVDECPSPGR